MWDGTDPGEFALILGGQQLVVLLRILTRAGHLGAASAYLRRSKEAGAPAAASTPPSERTDEPSAEPEPEPAP